jgi:pimeloyl-ACP methyl ester carboxylesterase
MVRTDFVVLVAGLALASCAPAPSEEPAPAKPTQQLNGSGSAASADGVEIAYTVHRLGDPNLVLVHGWMCDQSYWEQQVPALAEGFGVITLDLAGHGASGAGRESWTTASLGEDVKAVVEHLGLERVIVIGHSMGGRVGLEAARLLPGSVIGVIGVDTLQDADAKSDPKEMEPLLAALESEFAATCEGFVRPMFGQGADAAVVERIVADMCGGPGPIGAALLRDYLDYEVGEAMRAAGVPVRAINADKWPTQVENNRAYCDFDATILPGYGHFLMQEAPDALNGALVDTVLAIVTGGAKEQADEGV